MASSTATQACVPLKSPGARLDIQHDGSTASPGTSLWMGAPESAISGNKTYEVGRGLDTKGSVKWISSLNGKPFVDRLDSKVLSRQHAAIIVGYDAKRVWCKDLKSSHGTYVTRKNVEHKVPSNGLFELRSGDVISFGKDVTKGSSNFKAIKCRFSRYTSATIRSATVSKTTPVSTTSAISSASPSAPAPAPAPVNPAHEAYKAKLAAFRAGVEKLSSYREAQKKDAAAVPTKPPELISLSPAKRAAQWVESITPSQPPAGTPPSVGNHAVAAAAAGAANTSTATISAPRPSGRYGLDIGNSQPNDTHEITKSTTATPLSAEKASEKAVADFVRRSINDLVATVSRKGATAESSASGSVSTSDSCKRISASKDHTTDSGAPADASLNIKQECAGKHDEHAQSPNARLSETQVVSTDDKSANSDGKSDGDNEEDEPRLSESNSACPEEDGAKAYNESRSSSHREESDGEDESAPTKPASELNDAHRADAAYDDDEDLLDHEDDWSFDSDTQPIYDPSYEMGSPAVLARYEAAFNEAWDRWLEKGDGMKRNESRCDQVGSEVGGGDVAEKEQLARATPGSATNGDTQGEARGQKRPIDEVEKQDDVSHTVLVTSPLETSSDTPNAKEPDTKPAEKTSVTQLTTSDASAATAAAGKEPTTAAALSHVWATPVKRRRLSPRRDVVVGVAAAFAAGAVGTFAALASIGSQYV